MGKKGFTLIELMIMISIIGIIAATFIPYLGSSSGDLVEIEVAADEDVNIVTTSKIEEYVSSPPSNSNIRCHEGISCLFINGEKIYLCNVDEWGDYQPISCE